MSNSCYNCKYKKEVGVQWNYHYICDHNTHRSVLGFDTDELSSSVCDDHDPNADKVSSDMKAECGFRKIK